MFHSLNPCTDFHQIFRICLPQEDLELVRFWGVSGNNCCHGNTLKASLENKKIVEKTIKYLELQNGESVTNQFEILNHVKDYYVNLFMKKSLWM